MFSVLMVLGLSMFFVGGLVLVGCAAYWLSYSLSIQAGGVK